jgi:hypothetical protein
MRTRSAAVAASLAFAAIALAAAAARAATTPLSAESTVPGLPGYRELFTPPPVAPPTARQCASAWNADGPQRTRAWIAARHPAGVRIVVGVASSTPGSGKYGPLCSLTFYLRGGQVVMAQGPWTGRAAPRWQGMLRSPFEGELAAMLNRLNGSVRRSGTVRCEYECSRTAKLPSAPVVQPSLESSLLPDACALLTAAQVRGLFGHAPKHRAGSSGSSGGGCTWQDEPLNVLAAPKLVVQVVTMTKANFVETMSRSSTMRPLASFGELAYATRGGAATTFVSLSVWRGGTVLLVGTSVPGTSLEMVETLARSALARL